MKNSGIRSISGKTEENNELFNVPVSSVFEKFGKARDVNMVYGDAIDMPDKKVVPVAKVVYSFGGGTAFTGKTGEKGTEASGGGGGHFTITPLGVYNITKCKTEFKRTGSGKSAFILGCVLTAGLFGVFMSFFNKGCTKN